MSREVANKESVRAARDLLLNRGETPTQRKVQAITGGSMTHVNRLLKELDDESQGPGVRIAERLGSFVMTLHAELQQQAQETVARGAAESQKLVDRAQADLEVVQKDFADLQNLLKEAQKKIDAQAAEYSKVVGQFNNANREIAGLAEKLTAAEASKGLFEARSKRLEIDLAREKEANEGFQTFTLEERRKAQVSFDAALSSLRNELQEARNLTSTANLAYQESTAQNLALNRDAERLIGEVGQLTKKNHELQDLLRSERGQLDVARQAETQQRIATASAEGQISLLSRQLEEHARIREEALYQKRMLKGEVSELKAANQALESSVSVLKESSTRP